MVACGILMLVLIGLAFYDSTRHKIGERKWLLKALLARHSAALDRHRGWLVCR